MCQGAAVQGCQCAAGKQLERASIHTACATNPVLTDPTGRTTRAAANSAWHGYTTTRIRIEPAYPAGACDPLPLPSSNLPGDRGLVVEDTQAYLERAAVLSPHSW
jgi:hypothetical protein